MKKLFFTLLAVVMIAGTAVIFTACSDDGDNDTVKNLLLLNSLQQSSGKYSITIPDGVATDQ